MLFSWCPAKGSGSEREIKVAFNHCLPAGLLTFDPSLQPQGLALQQSRSSQWDSKGWQTVIARHAENPRGRRVTAALGVWRVSVGLSSSPQVFYKSSHIIN